MEQRVEPLSDEERAPLERQRIWVRDHHSEDSISKYDTVEGKLNLLCGILDQKWVEADEWWKLQSLGVTFGDALAEHLGLVWVGVEDEINRQRVLQDIVTKTFICAVPMIEKRITRGEEFEVRFVFAELCKTVLDWRAAWPATTRHETTRTTGTGASARPFGAPSRR